jgi:hypothetical protein
MQEEEARRLAEVERQRIALEQMRLEAARQAQVSLTFK